MYGVWTLLAFTAKVHRQDRGKIPIRGCAAISRVRSAGEPARLTLAGVVVSLVQIGRVVDARGRLGRYLRWV
jgi:hypothetical protein